MPLPDDFSPVEHWQDTVKLIVNQLVFQEFADVGDEAWAKDLSSARASLRVACTHEELDTIDLTLGRLFLLYFTLRKARDIHHPVYGMPIDSYQISKKFKPQIFLYFSENYSDVEPGYKPVAGEIKFRLINESDETITQPEMKTLGNKIKTLFGASGGFIWKKGKILAAYTDNLHGYKLQILARDITEAKRVITQILEIQNHAPNWALMNVSSNQEPTEAFPTIPANHTVLGKTRRKQRRRPIASVKFQYALLHLHSLPSPICLFDRVGGFSNSIVR